MQEKKSGESSSDPQKRIPISDHNVNLQSAKNSEVFFDLGVKPSAGLGHKPAADYVAPPEPTPPVQTPTKKTFSLKNSANLLKQNVVSKFKNTTSTSRTSRPASRTSQKTWQVLEFLSVTAAIFAIFFLILNYDSYSTLFWNKWDQLNGKNNQNPYSQQQTAQQTTTQNQEPLPIVQNPETAKKQFPALSMEVAPPDDRIIISRINRNVPVVRISTETLLRKDWAALESQIQGALQHGVVHYPGTAYPGDKGNVVITGHSSYFPWDPGRFKDVFALLHQVSVGDEIVVYQDQKKYKYVVYEKKVVRPSQVEVLTQDGADRLTLITCTPVGTDLNRLIVLAKPV
jgi:LPXTG-site transpeptidase (sortase) family protein